MQHEWSSVAYLIVTIFGPTECHTVANNAVDDRTFRSQDPGIPPQHIIYSWLKPLPSYAAAAFRNVEIASVAPHQHQPHSYNKNNVGVRIKHAEGIDGHGMPSLCPESWHSGTDASSNVMHASHQNSHMMSSLSDFSSLIELHHDADGGVCVRSLAKNGVIARRLKPRNYKIRDCKNHFCFRPSPQIRFPLTTRLCSKKTCRQGFISLHGEHTSGKTPCSSHRRCLRTFLQTVSAVPVHTTHGRCKQHGGD